MTHPVRAIDRRHPASFCLREGEEAIYVDLIERKIIFNERIAAICAPKVANLKKSETSSSALLGDARLCSALLASCARFSA